MRNNPAKATRAHTIVVLNHLGEEIRRFSQDDGWFVTESTRLAFKFDESAQDIPQPPDPPVAVFNSIDIWKAT